MVKPIIYISSRCFDGHKKLFRLDAVVIYNKFRRRVLLIRHGVRGAENMMLMHVQLDQIVGLDDRFTGLIGLCAIDAGAPCESFCDYMGLEDVIVATKV